MNSLGTYLLQMACWLTAFWLVYVLLLKKETFFHLNRWFLVTGLLFSLFAPMVPVTYKIYHTFEPVISMFNESVSVPTIISEKTEQARNINYWLLIYLAGCSFYLIRFVIQNVNLFRLRKESEYSTLDTSKVFHIDRDTPPFSFLNNIYVSSKMSDNTELKTIIAHEKVHINERHWTDLLLLEVVRTLQWFNPLLIFYRKAIMQNHEFLADTGTLEYGVSARTYQAVLVNQAMGNQVFKFANSFTFLNATKRLIMMKKDKSRPIKRLKLLFILPFMATIVVGFARPKYIYTENPEINKINSAIDLDATNNAITENEGVEQRENSALIAANTLNESATKGVNNTITGIVADEDGNPLANTIVLNIGLNGQFKGQVKTDANGAFTMENVRINDILTFSHLEYESIKIKVQGEHELKVKLNAKPTDKGTETINSNLQNEQKTIYGIITDEDGSAIMGATVVEIDDQGRYLNGSVTDKNGNYNITLSNGKRVQVSILGHEKQLVEVKDQKELNVSLKLNPQKIEAITVTSSAPTENPNIRIRGTGKPFIIVDGKILEKNTNDFDFAKADIEDFGILIDVTPEDIESIEVLKDEATIDKFSEMKGNPTNGVLFIKTKKHDPSDSEKAILKSEGPLKISEGKLNAKNFTVVKIEGNSVAIPVQTKTFKMDSMAYAEEEEEKKDIPFMFVEDMPSFNGGGLEEFKKYVQEKVIYPPEAQEGGIQGRVTVSFIIGKNGFIEDDIKILRGVHPLLDNEVVRVVKEAPQWTPGKQRGEPVRILFSMPINFVLN